MAFPIPEQNRERGPKSDRATLQTTTQGKETTSWASSKKGAAKPLRRSGAMGAILSWLPCGDEINATPPRKHVALAITTCFRGDPARHERSAREPRKHGTRR